MSERTTSLRNWLLEQLGSREWNQSDLARAIGASSSQVSRWINGRDTPSPRYCRRLADVFHADPDFVLALAGHRSQASGTDTEMMDPRVRFYFLNFPKLPPDRQRVLLKQLEAEYDEYLRELMEIERREGHGR